MRGAHELDVRLRGLGLVPAEEGLEGAGDERRVRVVLVVRLPTRVRGGVRGGGGGGGRRGVGEAEEAREGRLSSRAPSDHPPPTPSASSFASSAASAASFASSAASLASSASFAPGRLLLFLLLHFLPPPPPPPAPPVAGEQGERRRLLAAAAPPAFPLDVRASTFSFVLVENLLVATRRASSAPRSRRSTAATSIVLVVAAVEIVAPPAASGLLPAVAPAHLWRGGPRVPSSGCASGRPVVHRVARSRRSSRTQAPDPRRWRARRRRRAGARRRRRSVPRSRRGRAAAASPRRCARTWAAPCASRSGRHPGPAVSSSSLEDAKRFRQRQLVLRRLRRRRARRRLRLLALHLVAHRLGHALDALQAEGELLPFYRHRGAGAEISAPTLTAARRDGRSAPTRAGAENDDDGSPRLDACLAQARSVFQGDGGEGGLAVASGTRR